MLLLIGVVHMPDCRVVEYPWGAGNDTLHVCINLWRLIIVIEPRL